MSWLLVSFTSFPFYPDNNQVSSGEIPSLTCTASEWSGPPSSCARETITVSLESVKKLKRAVSFFLMLTFLYIVQTFIILEKTFLFLFENKV